MQVHDTTELKLELPSPSDTIPRWVVSDPSVLDIVPRDDGYAAEIAARKAGSCTVCAIANCDLGSGVREHVVNFDIIVTDSEETAQTVNQPEPEPAYVPYWKGE